MCSPEQLGAALTPHLSWFLSPQYGNSKPKRSKTCQAPGRICCGILYPRLCESGVGTPLQAGAGCLLQLPPCSHTARQEGMLEQAQGAPRGMLTPVTASGYAQALLLCPATPTDHFVFFTPSLKWLLSLRICWTWLQRCLKICTELFPRTIGMVTLSALGSSKPKVISSPATIWRELLLGLERVSVAVLVTPRLVAVTLGDTLVGSSAYQEDKQNVQLPTVPGVRASSLLWGASLPGNILHSLVLIAGSSPAWLR